MTSPPVTPAGYADADAPGVRRAPTALVTGTVVALVLVVVIGLLVVKISEGSRSAPASPVAAAPTAVVQAVTTVDRAVSDTVGAPAGVAPLPVVLGGQRPLRIDGKPAVVFVGSEFSPYCAALRWALVVALSRFGTLGRLGATTSSRAEAFGALATFSFSRATYRSRRLAFSAVEEYGPALSTTYPAGFPALRRPDRLARALLARYGGGSGTLPFVDIGNRVVVDGDDIGFSPASLQGLSMAQIAADLSEPTSPVASAVLGTANELTAGICAVTGGLPRKLCRSPGVRAGALRLGLT